MALIVRLLIWNSKNSKAFVKNQTPISHSNFFFLNKRDIFLETIILVCQHLKLRATPTHTKHILYITDAHKKMACWMARVWWWNRKNGRLKDRQTDTQT